MDKFGSVIDRMNMKLGSKLLNSLRSKTQFLERLQSVSVVYGATHTQKDDVESKEAPRRIFILGEYSLMLQRPLCCSCFRHSASSEVWCPHSDLNEMSIHAFFFFFFFWWGLLHGPQQGPNRMKEKNL